MRGQSLLKGLKWKTINSIHTYANHRPEKKTSSLILLVFPVCVYICVCVCVCFVSENNLYTISLLNRFEQKNRIQTEGQWQLECVGEKKRIKKHKKKNALPIHQFYQSIILYFRVFFFSFFFIHWRWYDHCSSI